MIVHTILGLPGESDDRILETMKYLNQKDIQGIKLQLLHVLKGTDLAYDYLAGRFRVYEREEYLDLVIRCLESGSRDRHSQNHRGRPKGASSGSTLGRKEERGAESSAS